MNGEPVYGRFWKELTGPFKIEKRKCQGRVSYSLTRRDSPDSPWEFINSYSSRTKARAYVKREIAKTAPIKTAKQCQTPEEIYALKEQQRRNRAEVRRNRAFNLVKEKEAERAERERIEEDAREAKGLPRKPLYGVTNAEAYLRIMRDKHGEDWKPTTLRVFDNGIKD